jgi:hypothetical protein
MTLVARLTWQVPDPEALAVRLRRGLLVTARPGGLVAGALTVDLGVALLELRPWRRESPADRPRTAGRLVFEPVAGGDDASAPGMEDAPAPGRAEVGTLPVVLVGVAWATVDLDRAEAELDPWLAPRGEAVAAHRAHDADPHLGARTRCRGAGSLPGGSLVLAEPSTEGRLAASLARDGEGPCALYLAVPEGLDAWRRGARGRGLLTSTVRPGPLGPSALVVGGGVAGPHLVIVQPPGRSSPGTAAGTIAP